MFSNECTAKRPALASVSRVPNLIPMAEPVSHDGEASESGTRGERGAAGREAKRRVRMLRAPEGASAAARASSSMVGTISKGAVGGGARGERRGEEADRLSERRVRLPQPPSGEGIAVGVNLHVGHPVVMVVTTARGRAKEERVVNRANVRRVQPPQPPSGEGIAEGVNLRVSRLVTMIAVGGSGVSSGVRVAGHQNKRRFHLPQPPSGEGIAGEVGLRVSRLAVAWVARRAPNPSSTSEEMSRNWPFRWIQKWGSQEEGRFASQAARQPREGAAKQR